MYKLYEHCIIIIIISVLYINQHDHDHHRHNHLESPLSSPTIIIRFLTLFLASLSTPSSTRVRTASSLPYLLAKWRAVDPYYNNNEEMRHENKIKNKNC